MTPSPITFHSQRQDRAASSIGQVSSEPLTWAVTAAVTVGAASGTLLAAAAGTGRLVWIKVPSSASVGIHIDFAAAAATTDMLIEPGETVFIATEQEIRAIRAGSADVTVYLAAGAA